MSCARVSAVIVDETPLRGVAARSVSAHGAAFVTATLGVTRSEACPVALSDEVIRASADHDLAGILELANHRNDACLRGLDVALSRRSEHLQLFFECGRRTLRHAAHDLVLDLVARRLERECELLDVDLAQQTLERSVVETDH